MYFFRHIQTPGGERVNGGEKAGRYNKQSCFFQILP